MTNGECDHGVDRVVIGIDIGGTFTDICAMLPDGRVHTTKVSSTPPDFAEGFLAGITQMAQELGTDERDLISRVSRIGHGTTVATNSLVTRRGAKVGLLTTAGHADAASMMRGGGRTAGLATEQLADVKSSAKPTPFIESSMIREIHQRMDKTGAEIVELDEDGTRAAVRDLLSAGADAFAVSLLWSTRNDAHERRVAAIVREEAGEGAYVTESAAVSRRIGEYERTIAAVLNSFVAQEVMSYLDTVIAGLRARSFDRHLVVMQSSGGVAAIDRLLTRPLSTFQSGPVAGVIACGYLGEAIQSKNLIAIDMGGTTLDVAVLHDGEPEMTSTCVIDRHSFYLPTVDVRSIGAGGGSIARYDAASRSLRVGPASAGARPGPVCYARGGVEPTVTDASVVLGLLDPEYFLGGSMRLDVEAARRAIGELGEKLGLDVDETAAGILAVVEAHMADLIRGMTIARGYDPRDFDLVAYGGAGPQHGLALVREIGARRVIVPQASAASAWSALGVAAADLVSRSEHAELLRLPFDMKSLRETFAGLRDTVTEDLGSRGGSAPVVSFEADVQYEGQIHPVTISITDDLLGLDAASFATNLADIFDRRYAELFGDAATLPGTPAEILVCRAAGKVVTPKPGFLASSRNDGQFVEVKTLERSVYWPDLKTRVDTLVYRLAGAAPVGSIWNGPCIVEMPQTSAVVPTGCTAEVDELGNIIMFASDREGAPL